MTLPFQLSEALAEVAGQLRESVVQVQVGDRGIGSGIIWQTGEADATGASEATIITNAHVVRAARQEDFKLKLADGRSIEATLIGAEPEIDLAALRVHATGLHAAEIGDSAALRVGELAIAVGNPFGREGAVTFGVVAARAPADEDVALEPAEEAEQGTRDAEGRRGRTGARFHNIEVIQADIRLYPGNSGGPLADAGGRVVGVNAMVGGGLGFAIPSRVVRQFLADLGHQAEPVYLGVELLTVPLAPALRQRAGIEQETAAMITNVLADSPAEAAGLLPGDVLLALDGRVIADARLLPRLLNRYRGDISGGEPRTLTILRGGERNELSLTPTVRKAA